jgi:ribosome maturation factor RimP
MDLEKIHAAAERVARSLGMEVVEVEWKVGKQRFLRVYIDRPEGPADPSGAGPASSTGAGVSHKDCQAVSEQLSVILDVEELVPGPRYILEISSPGLDRKLLKPADYERFVGRRAKVWTVDPVENTKYLEGRLRGYADGIVQIEVKDHVVGVPFAGIRKAQLVVEF